LIFDLFSCHFTSIILWLFCHSDILLFWFSVLFLSFSEVNSQIFLLFFFPSFSVLGSDSFSLQAVRIKRIRAVGVSGDITMLVRHPETPLPNVQIKEMYLERVKVDAKDKHKREIPIVFPTIKIERFAVENYRLRKLLNALLFNAEGTGACDSAVRRRQVI
jgi:hypothetical protein